MNTEIKNQIEAQKEVLSTLPQNNVKNKSKYYKKIDELYDTYNEVFERIKTEISTRNKNTKSKITKSDDYKELEEEQKKIKEKFYLFNKYNTSYEKLEFDKLLYNLSVNEKDLNYINKTIYECILKFKNVGINLTPESFKYSPMVYEYMKSYFKYINNLEDNTLKEEFEKLYWKSPNIIIHIELTIKNLYFKYKKYFDKYIELEKEKEIKKYGKNPKEIYNTKKVEYDLCIRNNVYEIFNQFVARDLNPDDYTDSKIKQLVTNYIELDYFNNNYDLCIENFYKLCNTLSEYKSYLNYNFIIEDMRNLYKEKEKFKNAFNTKYKEIQKEEKKLNKIVRKLYFNSKRTNKEELIDKLNMEIDALILNLKKLYDSLEEEKINENLLKLSDNSEVISLLEIANSFYIYHIKCLEKLPEKPEISESINNLRDLLISPYNNLINNINIGDTKDISVIISDLYKLSNIKIDKETLSDTSNLDTILDNLNKIFKYNLLMKNNISLEDLLFVYQVSDIDEIEK